MSNEDPILDMISILKKGYSARENKCALFIVGDVEAGTALADCQGNQIVLMQAFGNIMQKQEQFNQLMKAMFGSYLSAHPEEKEEFIRGLELVKNTPSQN